MYTIELLLLFIVPCYALNFGIPLPNTLILAGASSLVTWNGLGNVTATNLYLGNGASEDRLTIIKIFGQNIPSSKTSMWVTLPKDTPSDNTPTQCGSWIENNASAVPTAGPSSSSSAPPSSSSGSSSSTSPSSSSESTKTNQPSKTRSDTSDATSSTDADTQPSSDDDNDNDTNLSSGQAAGVIVGSIGAAGLVLGAIFFIRRKRRLNNHKRHTELFDEKDNMDATAGGGIYHDYNNNSNHQHYSPPPRWLYSRSFSHTQPPPSAYYPMKTIESTDMHDNGFQSRTQISPTWPLKSLLMTWLPDN
ncbi:hypothetical protein BCR42DRAFT_429207 [Absidia repens]|uniref:Mid2 domain-containing protein n=1 Tax=Absidia repens TaxID=90262 RepID=A0A1X2HXB9_9FUNG|nr:hypothetical protein BCR42DRAFT_429207 [Absidia repens]